MRKAICINVRIVRCGFMLLIAVGVAVDEAVGVIVIGSVGVYVTVGAGWLNAPIRIMGRKGPPA